MPNPPSDPHYYLRYGEVWISDKAIPYLTEIDSLYALDLLAQGYPKFRL